jgi:hypothetical protein
MNSGSVPEARGAGLGTQNGECRTQNAETETERFLSAVACSAFRDNQLCYDPGSR